MKYKVVSLVTALFVTTDAVFTYFWVSRHYAYEWNVSAAWLTDTFGLGLGLLLRTVLAIAGVAYIYRIATQDGTRAARMARTGLWVLLGVYLLVNVYHVLGGIVWA